MPPTPARARLAAATAATAAVLALAAATAATAAVLALAAAPTPLSAQRADSLAAGARVRGAASSAGDAFDGAVVRADSVGLTVRTAGRGGDSVTAAYAWRDIRALARYDGRRSAGEAFGRGARRTALVLGALTVVGVGAGAVSDATRGCRGCGSAAAGVAVVGLFWTGVGAVVGGTAGLASRERWTRVAVPR